MTAEKHKVTDFYKLLNPLYKRLVTGFADWQRILNYEKTSQKDMPKMITEFLRYMQNNGITDPLNITETHLQNYYIYLEQRPNRLRGGSISKNYIRKNLQAIRRFARYLGESGHESFTVNIKLTGRSSNVKDILLPIEIAELYEHTTDDPLGYRDRAMLALYYGCGLRKQEGLSVNVEDVQLEKELLLVRKGKGYKSRYVPLNKQSIRYLSDYLLYGRPFLNPQKKRKILSAWSWRPPLHECFWAGSGAAPPCWYSQADRCAYSAPQYRYAPAAIGHAAGTYPAVPWPQQP